MSKYAGAVNEAIESGMMSARIAEEIAHMMKEHPGELPSELVSTTGGEPLSDRMYALALFLKERGA